MRTDAVTRATLALLRIVAGFILFCPGAFKLFGWFVPMPAGFVLTPLLRTAGWIEVIGGPLLMLGLFTRPVAFLCSGEMAVAYFKGHFPRGVLPI
jgi:putative oxidoreductase